MGSSNQTVKLLTPWLASFSTISVHGTVSRLLGALVLDHLLLKADQDCLHGVGSLPVGKLVELFGVNLASCLVDTGQVNFRVEENLGLYGGVLLTSQNSQEVNTSVESSIGGSNDGAVPVGKALIVSLIEAVRYRLVGKLSLLSLFKLLVEPECSGHYIIS